MRLLYLDLDTLRPDHLGCYGYHRNTSPNIDRIAAEGIRFDNTYTPDAPCLPSRAALMSGRFGIHNGAVGHDGTCADMRPVGPGRGFRDLLGQSSIPALLKQSGLKTVYVGGFGERHSLWSYYAGFREIHDTGKGGMESAEHVTPTALAWIAQHAQEDDWYLHVNYWDPHTPYRAPAEFGNPFEHEPLAAWLTPEAFERTLEHVGPHSAHEINMWNDRENPAFPRQPGEIHDMAGLRRHIDGYDCGIRYMDAHIGRLLDALEQAGVLDDLCIIVSSDHGENHGELGLYGEHGTADQITCRIPMIIRWQGGVKGASDDALHYNLDLGPTLAELLGQAPKAIWDGKSYAKTLLTGEREGQAYLVLSQCCHVCQRSVRWGDWLYIRTYHDGGHLFPREMLYHLADDPHEERDLAADHPEVCAQAAHMLMDWHDDMMATQPDGHVSDPMRIVMAEGGPCHAKGALPAYAKRLEATGRAEGAARLRAAHPDVFGA